MMSVKEASEIIDDFMKECKATNIHLSTELIEALNVAIDELNWRRGADADIAPCEHCQEFDCYGCNYKEGKS